MKLSFLKLDGAGNDFVGLDWRGREPLQPEILADLTRTLCSRHHGIGADGVLVLYDSPRPESADFSMRYVNADGSIGEMCGNGARCMAIFAYHSKAAPAEMRFHTDAGLYHAEIIEGGSRIEFPDVEALPEERTLSGPLCAGRKTDFLLVGVPHAVLFTEDLDLMDVVQQGREIRHDPAFQPKGTNVNFAEVVGPETINLRTYERGVEGETLACGTGSVATACCYVWREKGIGRYEITVIPTGKEELRIAFERTETGFKDITLEGPARIVFRGEAFFEKGRLKL